MEKKKQKKNIKEIFKKISDKCSRFILNTRYFTIVFFSLTLFGSLWIWWSCYYAPKPSENVVASFESKKENFDSMKIQTEKTITLLQQKRDNYSNVPDLSSQRELFAKKASLAETQSEVIEPGAPLSAPEGKVMEEEKPQATQ